MRRGDCVEVASEVEVDFLHRQYLRIAATSCTALHAKAWTEGGFAEHDDGVLANLIKTQVEADRDSGLADTCLGGRDGGHEDEVALLDFLLVDVLQWYLGDVVAVRVDVLNGDACLLGNLLNSLKFAFTCDFNVALHSDNKCCGFRLTPMRLVAPLAWLIILNFKHAAMRLAGFYAHF